MMNGRFFGTLVCLVVVLLSTFASSSTRWLARFVGSVNVSSSQAMLDRFRASISF